MELSLPIICVVTRARGTRGSRERVAVLERLRSAADAGATMIQVRERMLDDRTLSGFIEDLVKLTSDTGCRVIVNDRLDIALAAGAAGVHLRATSAAAIDVRRVVADTFVVGRSIHSAEEAAAAQEAGGCDYLFFGTVFHSASKPDDHPVAGVDGLRTVCGRVSLPVVAIGGVTVSRAREIRMAGAAGAAAISLFSEANDIAEPILGLRNALTPSLRSV